MLDIDWLADFPLNVKSENLVLQFDKDSANAQLSSFSSLTLWVTFQMFRIHKIVHMDSEDSARYWPLEHQCFYYYSIYTYVSGMD